MLYTCMQAFKIEITHGDTTKELNRKWSELSTLQKEVCTLLKMGSYSITTMCHYWYMSLK